ncbi:MAG TPA: ROK family protein [Bacillota bacterium]|nr:ROK family protein [Bacillota bacterium]
MSIADVLNTSIYDAPKVREVLDDVAYMVGIAVSNLICLLNPDMVVLGGELAQAGDRFVGTVSRTAEARAIGEMSSMCRIVKSVMQQDPPLMGAYLLALGHVLTMDAWPS